MYKTESLTTINFKTVWDIFNKPQGVTFHKYLVLIQRVNLEMRLGMYVNLAVHVKCLLHFAGFNHNWIMTKLIDFPSNTFRENLLRVRRRDKWKGTERERERERDRGREMEKSWGAFLQDCNPKVPKTPNLTAEMMPLKTQAPYKYLSVGVPSHSEFLGYH
jgi:hypothetical protein